MYKRICIIISIIILVMISIGISTSEAATTDTVTQKQKIVGQAIANFAAYVSSHNEDDFGYSFHFGKNGEIMERAMENRKKANELGIKYCGYVYCATRQEALQTGGIVGYLENKFIVYCASYANLLVYYATGGYTVSEYGTNSFDALIPGDIVSVKYTDKGTNCGHTFVYIDDAGDDNPYTMRVAQSPGAETPDQEKRYHSIRIRLH